ncbi:MAG: DUF2070 family protein [Thaumarchaeota archaeon]|nr:DUF2070 family protein [Candidatus Calditenuaceae archaeon]MDW8042147.1 DUF2070 family protein [Nitrososphaerota archaeon]
MGASGIASKYKFLFRPPGADFAPLLLIATALVTAFVVEQGELSAADWMLWMGSLALAPIAVNVVASRSVYGGSDVVTLRRLNMLSLLENYFSLAASAIGTLYGVVAQGNQVNWRAYIASVSFSGYVRVTVLAALDGHPKGYPVGLAEALIRYFVVLGRPELYHHASVSMAVTLLAPLGSLAALSKGFSGTTPLRLARGFARAILSGNADLLERELRFLSTYRDFTSTAMVFRTSSGRKYALLVTDFHFGPFRNVGSSMMNYQVELELSKRGTEALVVKGCAGHEADIVDTSSVRRVVLELADRVSNGHGPSSNSISILPHRELDGVSFVGLKACGKSLVVATLHPMPMEDFPKSLEEPFRGRGVRLIDPHNSFRDGYDGLTEFEVGKVQRALEEFLKVDGVAGSARVALVKEVPEDLGPTEGIGPSGMSVLGVEVGGVRLALAVVDGNNALPDVRPSVIEAIREEGWDHVEFLTTDTHAVNGVRLGGRGYRTIGEVVSSKALAERLRRLAKRALSSMEEAEVSVVDTSHPNVPTLSSEALERLSVLMQKSIAVYVLIMVASGLLPLIL